MLHYHSRIIAIVCLISSLSRFALDSYLPSLPAIGDHFDISDTSTQLTITTYLLGFSFSQLAYGPLSDCYGRKYTILIGLFIFLIANLICSIAHSHILLLIFRFIAGIGAGACGVLNRTIASDCFSGKEFSKAWSYTTSTLVITLILAPVIGGHVQDIMGWRANFIISAMFISLTIYVVLRFLPETHSNMSAKKSLALDSILKDYYRILSSRKFIFSTASYTLAFAGLMLYFQVSPILYIDVFGLTATQYGWSSVFIAVSYLLGGLIVNRYVDVMGIPRMLFLGTSLLFAGGFLMLLVHYSDYANVFTILFTSSIYVVGARIVIPNAIANSMEKNCLSKGSRSALIGCIQMLGATFFSLLIAHFEHDSSFPLAMFLTILGLMSVSLIYLTYEKRLAAKALSR